MFKKALSLTLVMGTLLVFTNCEKKPTGNQQDQNIYPQSGIKLWVNLDRYPPLNQVANLTCSLTVYYSSIDTQYLRGWFVQQKGDSAWLYLHPDSGWIAPQEMSSAWLTDTLFFWQDTTKRNDTVSFTIPIKPVRAGGDAFIYPLLLFVFYPIPGYEGQPSGGTGEGTQISLHVFSDTCYPRRSPKK